jgi:hypothetical protein
LLNAKYVAAFEYVREKNHFAYLARQVYPEERNGLYESFLDNTRRSQGYLLPDFAQVTDDSPIPNRHIAFGIHDSVRTRGR